MRTWVGDACSAAVFVGVLGFAVAVGVIDIEKSDVYVYHGFGMAIIHGAVPYRDLAIEYPPGALPLFIAPALFTSTRSMYDHAFAGMMLMVAAVLMAVVRRIGRELQRGSETAPRPRLVVPVLIVVLGSVAVTRFDLVPAALMTTSLLLVIKGRHRLGALALGIAIAVKLYPAVALPLIIIHVARRAGYRAAAGATAIVVGVVAAAYAPFVLLSAGGVRYSLSVQLFRSLEIESIGGSLYVAIHRAFGIPLAKQTSYYDFGSHSAHTIGLVSDALGLAIIGALWIAYGLTHASPASLVRYTAAAVTAFVAFGKVLSPQYLLWLVPLVPLVVGRRGRVATGLLGVACLLTAAAFPRQWEPALVQHLAATPLTITVIRDLLLISLLGVLSLPTAWRKGRAYSLAGDRRLATG
jgi:uncharacterized membrane protein